MEGSVNERCALAQFSRGVSKSVTGMAEYNKASTSDAASGMTKLGALLREQLNNKSE